MPQWFERSMDTVHDEHFIKGFFEEYRWASNFHLCEVHYEGRVYPSSENAYQAAKAELGSEKDKFMNITPGQSKKLGRAVLMRSDWDKVKVRIMEEICRDKFTRNEDLRKLLLETRDKHLEETNWWSDKFWGVCKGIGQNQLGKILMKIREELKMSAGVALVGDTWKMLELVDKSRLSENVVRVIWRDEEERRVTSFLEPQFVRQ